jgi:SRSO17 transposase
VLVVEETGEPNKGTHTVGMQRRYSGTAGKIENCQRAVHRSYPSPLRHTLLDVALYRPKSWSGDPARRRAAGVPASVGLATKRHLARRLSQTALAGGLPCRQRGQGPPLLRLGVYHPAAGQRPPGGSSLAAEPPHPQHR